MVAFNTNHYLLSLISVWNFASMFHGRKTKKPHFFQEAALILQNKISTLNLKLLHRALDFYSATRIKSNPKIP